MPYYAHSSKATESSAWHLLSEHLADTAITAQSLADAFGGGQLAYVAALLHDVGKYSSEFQARLAGSNIKVDHSTAGAVEAKVRYGNVGHLLAYAVAGHHSGLPDWGSEADDTGLMVRMKKELPDYSAFLAEVLPLLPVKLAIPPIKTVAGAGFSVQFLIRFIYSCLVDADYLDTEKALSASKAALRQPSSSLENLSRELDAHLQDMCCKASNSPVNIKRAEILSACRKKAPDKPGLFTLTVPTGGGKTLSSLSFALRHAVAHEMRRIIYVMPYTSIIEQNAAIFKAILGSDNVLEHHSNFSYPQTISREMATENTDDGLQKLRLATENWDMPIVATTNVQFFESLFASRSSRCRKLHNIANSVIVLDEAQMIPTGFLKPCLSAIVELVTNYRATVVLCTATQPAIKSLLPASLVPVEIIGDPSDLYDHFKRVRVQNLGELSDSDLALRLSEQHQVLCVVNSKKHARLLHAMLQGDHNFHLSTRMCPAHRTTVIQAIKDRLKNGQTCRVISTQLIEAGVDIDFPVVYRSMAGIDSIAQAAGRCNREGRLPEGQVYVFWPDKHGMPKGWLQRTASLGGVVMDMHEDPLHARSIRDYFSLLYEIDDAELDKEKILAEIREQERKLCFPFRTVAEKFSLIDNDTHTVLIPWDDVCKQALATAEQSRFPGTFARKLQRYGVEVYVGEFKELIHSNALVSVGETYFVLREEVMKEFYCVEIGLKPLAESAFLQDTLMV
ncbi:MAG: CRISPR-associated helicase Cas3' [Firmicutes bacterium]|nr:CRISPR-associated helicase Cas3' [Dethiobacter sp.]MBS3887679.1 CRISPR-associated helicase Cas3' [Bacillota bacterium]